MSRKSVAYSDVEPIIHILGLASLCVPSVYCAQLVFYGAWGCEAEQEGPIPNLEARTFSERALAVRRPQLVCDVCSRRTRGADAQTWRSFTSPDVNPSHHC